MTTTSNFQTVIFLHVPKTGGSTLRWIIAKQTRSRGIYRIEAPDHNYQKRIDEFKTLPDLRKQKIEWLVGHMGFGLHEYLPQPSTYITLLREPIDRVLSFYDYAHLKARPNDNTDVKEFILRGGSKQVNNGQTRMLASLYGDYPDDVAFGRCSDEMLKIAKQNLREHFVGFGLTEQFDASIIHLRRKLGWWMPLYITEKGQPETQRIRFVDKRCARGADRVQQI
jgi:hypothetical protein